MIREHAGWAARQLGRPDLDRRGVTHLLVTNDFPPKVGGIQAYLWELWSRLDPGSFAVLTASSSPDQGAFDRRAGRPGGSHRAGLLVRSGADARAHPAHPAECRRASAPTW